MAAYQAPLSMGLSRQEHWSGLPFPSPLHIWRDHNKINHWLPVRNGRGKVVRCHIKRSERKNCHPRTPCLLNLCFRKDGKIKIFPDKQRLGELIASSPTYNKYWKITFELKKTKNKQQKNLVLRFENIGLICLKDVCVSVQSVPKLLFSVLSSENKDAGKLWTIYSEGLF